jgi:hypothetical protein
MPASPGLCSDLSSAWCVGSGTRPLPWDRGWVRGVRRGERTGRAKWAGRRRKEENCIGQGRSGGHTDEANMGRGERTDCY